MHPVIKELYEAFRGYSLSGFTNVHWMNGYPSASSKLASIPLHSLTVCDLDDYSQRAISSWGTIDHFKHFLPRLLELCLDQFGKFSNPEAMFSKLSWRSWEKWPRREREAIQQFLMYFWQVYLHRPLELWRPDREITWRPDTMRDALGAIAATGVTLVPYLECWLNTKSEAAALHLADYIYASTHMIMKKKEIHLWGQPEPATTEFLEWLASDAVLAYLESQWEFILEPYPDVFYCHQGIRDAVLPR